MHYYSCMVRCMSNGVLYVFKSFEKIKEESFFLKRTLEILYLTAYTWQILNLAYGEKYIFCMPLSIGTSSGHF